MRKVSLLLVSMFLFAKEPNPEIKSYLDALSDEVKKENLNFKGFDIKRGEEIFTSTHIGKRGKKISCTSCHNLDLTTSGENVNTGKVIEPLAPSANSKRVTNLKDVKKWLRRNFKDVYNREGTSQEKGDVLVYILSK